MGSDLYVSVERRYGEHWCSLWDGPSSALERGIVVDAFGEPYDENTGRRVGSDVVSDRKKAGYLTGAEWRERAEHPECPWHLDEPYWVRCIPGDVFCYIVREKLWQKLQDGDFHDTECSPELRSIAAMVSSLLSEGLGVRVWCWHSQ
jgi:hypothetical protein